MPIAHVVDYLEMFDGLGIVARHDYGLAVFFRKREKQRGNRRGIADIQIAGRLIGKNPITRLPRSIAEFSNGREPSRSESISIAHAVIDLPDRDLSDIVVGNPAPLFSTKNSFTLTALSATSTPSTHIFSVHGSEQASLCCA